MQRIKRLRFYGQGAASREEWSEVIKGRQPFNAGAMSGKVTDPTAGPHSYGDLPDPYRNELRYARPDFVVYSYSTPIGWHDATTDQWHVPEVRYSNTTTSHQHTLRMAVDTYHPETGWAMAYISGPEVDLKGKDRRPYGPVRGGW